MVSGDGSIVSAPGRAREASPYVDDARSVLQHTDSVAYVLGLTGPQIEQMILEQSTAETQRLLRDLATVSDGLRSLATTFAQTSGAIRNQAAIAWEAHDKQAEHDRSIERAEQVPAFRTGGADEAPGPSRGY
jgi:hypothetical protein